jgi:hypothetical protein
MTSADTSCRAPRLRVALALIVLVAVSSGCGKKGPPLPPVRITPVAPSAYRARQVGLDVVLSAAVSPKRTNGTPLGDGASVEILRLAAGPSLRPGAVSERYLVQQFLKQARPVASIPESELKTQMIGGRLQFIDKGAAAPPAAPAATPAPPAVPAAAAPQVTLAYLYGMLVTEPGGGRSPMRAPVFVELGAPPSPPGPLRAETAEGEVRLRWEPPGPGAASYNVYRRAAADARDPDAPLNAAPLTKAEYADRTFTYDNKYVYFVRTVASGKATPCESVAGPTVEVLPHDSFPPAAPTGIAVAVEGGQIRLYWFPNAEPDLAGYRIYRRTEEGSESQRIAEVGSSDSSYVDASAAPGVRYHYSVSAVDGATPPNESPRSEERAERLEPPDRPAEKSNDGAGEQP